MSRYSYLNPRSAKITTMTLIRLPGLIDPHVHLRDPGQTDKEDFLTGTRAALHGGYTTIIDMPNNKNPITTQERLDEKVKSAKEKIVCDVGFYFGTLGDNLDEFDKVQKNVRGLKIYLNHTTGNFILDKTKLKEIFSRWPTSLPILFHAEEETFDSVLELVKESPRRIHLCHMSTEYELKQIIKAKENGLPVTCGVTPHHLFLTEDDAKSLGPWGMMKPILKSKRDVAFLWNHLSAIDMIESDHAPHTVQEKESTPVPFGVPGLETTLPLLLTAVNENRLTIEDIIRLCFTGPAELINFHKDATTFSEIDMNESYEIQNEALFTKCQWTPFDGYNMRGKIRSVTLRGKVVMKDDTILASPGSGKIL